MGQQEAIFFFDPNKKGYERSTNDSSELAYLFLKVWKEINSIRKNNSDNLYILKRSHLDRCIKLILDDVISNQENDFKSDPEASTNLSLCKFEIKVAGNYSKPIFFLEVSYKNNVLNKILGIFKNSDSGLYKIAKSLIDKQFTSPIEEGVRVSTFLKETNLKGIIGRYILPSRFRSEYEISHWYTTVCIGEQPEVPIPKTLYINPSEKDFAQLISEINKLQSLPE